MHPAVAAREVALGELCRRFHVRRLELFGSAARGVGEPRDLDFLVEFEPLPPGQRAPAYFGLLRELEALFGRPVDLVMATAVRNLASSPRSRASGQ
jgi:predicted nucleotidyltransferase